jgi:hypothetical protein
MRKTVLIAVGLAVTSFVLRRTRRFGPIGMVSAIALEEIVKAVRAQLQPAPPPKPSLWARLTGAKKPFKNRSA